MILVLLIASLLPASFGCLFNDIPPCSCVPIGNELTEITCKGATDVDELEKSLSKLTNKPVRTLYINDSSLLYLPNNILKGKKVQRLHLINSTFRDFTDSEVAFEGFGSTLYSFVIDHCRIFSGFRWDEFRNLNNLLNLKTAKVGLGAIDSDIGDIAGLQNLKRLELSQDSISYIDDRAFAKFQNLTDLILESNLISEMKRSMLPDPAPRLRLINLRYNEINSLPEDMFTNMPLLMHLLLDGNNLVTVNQKTFSPIWMQVTRVYLDGNPIRCDCRMKWIKKVNKFSLVQCVDPPHLAGQYIDRVEEDDLKC